MADVNRDGAAGTTVGQLKDLTYKRQCSNHLSSNGFVKKSRIDVGLGNSKESLCKLKGEDLAENNVDNISFWPVSFREVVCVIKKPFVLHSETSRTSALCYANFKLRLPDNIIERIKKSRVRMRNQAGKEVEGFYTQVWLRFGNLPATGNGSMELDDLFPKDLSIIINGELVRLNRNKLASERKKYSRPLEVTRLINLENSENEIDITWSESDEGYLSCGGSKTYVLGIYLFKLLQTKHIRNIITSKPFIPKIELLKKIWKTSDEEVQVTYPVSKKTQLSILCPITKKKMSLPCRSLRCQHYTCFELTSFLEMSLNAKRLKFICPICNEAVKMEDIRIDEYLHDALKRLEKYQKDVIWIHRSGSWKKFE